MANGFAGTAAAAILGQVGDDAVHRVEVSGIDDETAFLARLNQSGAVQFLQVEGERRGRDGECLGHLAGGMPCRPGLNQQPKNREPGLLSQRTERGNDIF